MSPDRRGLLEIIRSLLGMDRGVSPPAAPEEEHLDGSMAEPDPPSVVETPAAVDPTPAGPVEQALGYSFTNRALLERSLVHRSYLAEKNVPESYERLEFLGDAVLQLAVTRFIYDEYPDMSEGEMAKVRAAVVNERVLASVARSWSLGDAVLLGRGEELTGGREKESILSDACEAVIGAVYLEGGIDAATTVVLSHWAELIGERASAPGMADYKTRLQERLASTGRRPEYVVTEEGPEHSKHFHAVVLVDGVERGSGDGTSKKRAEQAAARAASADLAGDA